MMNIKDSQLIIEDVQTPERLVLPSLCLSYITAYMPVSVVGLLLLDIGDTFGQSVGIMSQIQTIASLITAFTAVLMGVWSIRFNHKLLLLLGLLLITISVVGCSMAFNFFIMI